MISADTIASVHETSARSDAAYALPVDIASILREAGEPARKWPPAPGELVSLWDMLCAYAHLFVAISNSLRDLETLYADLDGIRRRFREEVSKRGLTVEEVTRRLLEDNDLKQIDSKNRSDFKTTCSNVLEMLQRFQALLPPLELNVCASKANEVIRILTAPPQYDMQYDVLFSPIREFRQLIERELEGRLFLYVSQNRVVYWSEEALFGKKVQRSFKKVVDDMVEAGKCIAVGRFTACVFHLTRIVEEGAKKFAKKHFPGLNIPHKATLGAIAKLISDEVVKIPSKTPQETEKKQEFSRIADLLSHFTEGWRNKTNHGGLSYNEEQAILLFNNARQFMQRLVDAK